MNWFQENVRFTNNKKIIIIKFREQLVLEFSDCFKNY